MGNRKTGFTLVEVALALLVASIGLLTVFALFPAGMDMNKRAIDDAQAAMFAEEVLNAVRAQACIDFNSIDNMKVSMPAIGIGGLGSKWRNWATEVVNATQGDAFSRITYTSVDVNAPEFSFLYNLRIGTLPSSPGGAKYCRLTVIPGQFSTTSQPSSVFYTELYDPTL